MNNPTYKVRPIDEDDISQHLTYSDGGECNHHIGTHQSQQDGNCRPQQRDEGKESHVCSPTPHKATCFVHMFGFHMQVLLKPFFLTHSAYTVVEDAAQHITNCTVDNQQPWIYSHSHQSQHHRLTGEWEEAASQECCQKHSEGTELY